MKIYIKCTRNGQTIYSKHEGMDETTIIELLTNLGGVAILTCSEEEYNLNLPE